MMPNGMGFVGGQADPSQRVAMALLQQTMKQGGGQQLAQFLPMLMQKMQNDPSRQVF